MRIVFMGTPEFAVTILNGLIESGQNVVGVITAPDKPAGRGRQLNQSAVKQYALEKGIEVLQPTNLKDENFIKELKELNADLFVVVAFRMLPEVVWNMPPKGTINLHGSLLPQYRGAAPINWALINGEKESGVTTFFIEKEIDTGNIIDSDKIVIDENMTAGELHDQLAELGKKTMVRTIENIRNSTTVATPQSNIEVQDRKIAPKIFKEDCKVDWRQSAKRTHDFIRGLSPYPGAWCQLKKDDKLYTCKLFSSSKTNIPVEKDQNSILIDEGFIFPCADYYIRIKEIQLEGKRKMTWKEFSAGNSIDQFSLLLQ